MAEQKPVLYAYCSSSSSWRVRLALLLKGIDYDYRPVELLKEGRLKFPDGYDKLNPMKQVPTLLIDGHTLTQSVAILEYLEETRPNIPFLPSDPADRAKVRMITETIVSGIQPLQNRTVLNQLPEDKRNSWTTFFLDKGFQSLEMMLSQTSAKYCVGDSVTIADICLFPQFYNCETRFKMDMSKFPVICRINAELCKLEAFQKSHPSQQPDYPTELK